MHIVYNNTNVKLNNIMHTLHSTKCIIHSAYLPRTVPIIKCKYEKKKMSDFKPFLAKLLQAMMHQYLV